MDAVPVAGARTVIRKMCPSDPLNPSSIKRARVNSMLPPVAVGGSISSSKEDPVSSALIYSRFVSRKFTCTKLDG
jgi:hypothetical protein